MTEAARQLICLVVICFFSPEIFQPFTLLAIGQYPDKTVVNPESTVVAEPSR